MQQSGMGRGQREKKPIERDISPPKGAPSALRPVDPPSYASSSQETALIDSLPLSVATPLAPTSSVLDVLAAVALPRAGALPDLLFPCPFVEAVTVKMPAQHGPIRMVGEKVLHAAARNPRYPPLTLANPAFFFILVWAGARKAARDPRERRGRHVHPPAGGDPPAHDRRHHVQMRQRRRLEECVLRAPAGHAPG